MQSKKQPDKWPEAMKFATLIIKNFRSIGPDGLSISFSDKSNLVALVGPNAAGKSNVLEALGIVLGTFPFKSFDPEESDFHCKNTEAEILIELRLNPPLVEHDVYRKEFEIAGFRYRAARYKRGDNKGALHKEHYCIDSVGKILTKPVRMFRRKGLSDDGADNTPKPVLVADQSWKLGELFYLDPPSLERFFDKTTGYSPLGRLFELYREDFEADHNQYSFDGQTKLLSKEAFRQFCGRLADILRTAKLSEIENGISDHIVDYLGVYSDRALHVEFALPSHREMFERLIGLQVSEHKDLPALPVDRLGAGYRALLRLAVLETLLDINKSDRGTVLLIEEPEIYLHVHLRRYFYGVLERLAGKGHQIVYVTHDPEFVDLGNPYGIVRLHRRPGEPTVAQQVKLNSTFNFPRMQQKVRRMGNAEVVFAQYAVLTEGQDDQGLIEDLFVRKGVDLNVHSISITNCDGVGQIKDYVRLCSELGIDFYVVHDRDDDTDASVKKRNAEIAASVAQTKPALPSLHIYTPDLEAMMGAVKKKHNLNQLLGMLGNKNYETISKNHPDLVKPIDEFVATRGLEKPVRAAAAEAAPAAMPVLSGEKK
jgi:putative ATP-dependent endonuclease of the OLD family